MKYRNLILLILSGNNLVLSVSEGQPGIGYRSRIQFRNFVSDQEKVIDEQQNFRASTRVVFVSFNKMYRP